jgi:hypothetical protein
VSTLALLIAWVAVIGTSVLVTARLVPAGRLEAALSVGVLALGLVVVDALVLGAGGGLARWPLLAAALGQFALAAAVTLPSRSCRARLAGLPAALTAAGRDGVAALRRAPLAAALVLLATMVAIRQTFAGLVLGVQDYDGLTYHLSMVMNWVRTGRVGVQIPENPFGNAYPGNLELHAAWTMAIQGSDLFTAVAQVPFALVLALATIAIGRRCGLSVSWAAAGGALVLLAPVVSNQLAMIYNDVAGAGAFAAGLHLLATALERTVRRSGLLLIAGAGLGLAAGVKTSFAAGSVVALVVTAGALLLGRARRPRRLRSALAGVGLAGAALAVLGLPFYLRDLLLFGNPLAPFAMSIGPLHLPGVLDLQRVTVIPSTPPELADRPALILPRIWFGYQTATPYWRVQQNFGWQWVFLQAPALLVWAAWLPVGRLLRRGPVRGELYHLVLLAPIAALIAANPTPWIFRYILIVLVPAAVAGCLALQSLGDLAGPIADAVRWPTGRAAIRRMALGAAVGVLAGATLYAAAAPSLRAWTHFRSGHLGASAQRTVSVAELVRAAYGAGPSLRVADQQGASWAQDLPAGSRIGVVPPGFVGQLYGRRAQNRLVVLPSRPDDALALLAAGGTDYVLLANDSPLAVELRRQPDRFALLDSAGGVEAYRVLATGAVTPG